MQILSTLIALLVISALSAVTTQEETSAAQPILDAHILVYHSVRPLYPGMTPDVRQFTVTPDELDTQFAYLRDTGYRVIPLDELVNATSGKVVALTFDDGWENQYGNAFPLLKQYGYPATFFVFTNAVGHAHYLTWDQLREMHAAGMAIGSHSASHPYLDQVSDSAQLAKEIEGSKAIIERELGTTTAAFSYPFGTWTPSLDGLVRKAGYREARLLGWGRFAPGDDPFALKGAVVTGSLATLKNILAY